ncbi:Hypothetical predicted protein [Pelobates cultripes]|uniref:Uncharacterized protein n=1 Tax=Pelobates cultripes TaxID=61616 RepID=A0AAD1SI97_PELCU|nr:Hypothetical predicted protein [Pelobates cultripes]
MYVPNRAGGLGVPHLIHYYQAAQLTQAQNLHAPYGIKRWVDLEHDIFGRDHPSLYIWLPKQARPPMPRTSPAVINTIRTWDRIVHKSGLTTPLSPLTPILRNTQFALGMTPKDFTRYEDNNLTRFHHFFQGQQLTPFPDLQQTTPFQTFDLFRHIQIKSFLSSPANTQAGTKPYQAHFDHPHTTRPNTLRRTPPPPKGRESERGKGNCALPNSSANPDVEIAPQPQSFFHFCTPSQDRGQKTNSAKTDV